MIQTSDVFLEVPCLTERSLRLGGASTAKKWFKGSDPRNLVHYLQKFIAYNSGLFGFLGVEPLIVGTDSNASLIFRTSNFVGTIPLRSPSTGKQIGDFVVAPRFVGRNRFEEYIEILDLLGSEISPHFFDSLPLVSGKIFRPPLYLEAVKFIASLEQILKQPWRKFDSVQYVTNEPVGQVDWNRYIHSQYKIENRLRFPIRKSTLSEFHSDFAEIRYVFDICKSELLSNKTPQRIRGLFNRRLLFIEEKLYLHKPEPTSRLRIHAADKPTVRLCKQHANKILERDFVDGTAWRVDFNDVFEKFVQHIFTQVAKSLGGKMHSNLRIPARTFRRFAWELHNLEPDAVLQKGEISISIDAKYKSNLFNKYESSDLLKDDYRRDVHQVLAYSSFAKTAEKIAVICYPSSEIETKTTRFESTVSSASTTLLLVGVPLNRQVIPEAVRRLSNQLNFLTQFSTSGNNSR